MNFLNGSTVPIVVSGLDASRSISTLSFLNCPNGCTFASGVNVVLDGAPGASFAYNSSGLTLSQLVSPAPVPEPQTYAMLLAGLGLMGAVARRRRQ